MKELLIYHSKAVDLTFYEVVPGTFVQADTLATATKVYQDHNCSIGRSFEGLKESFPDVQPVYPNPRELRNFENGDGPMPFELIPGHAVYSHSRESAEELYKRHCQVPGSDPNTFGAKIDDVFLRVYKVSGSVHVADYNKYGIPLNQSKLDNKMTLWQTDHGKPLWEVEPGRLVRAQTPEQAQDRYRDNPRYWSRMLEDISAFNTGFTGPIPPPSSVDSNWVRRFLDKDGDLAWLLKTPNGNDVLVYGEFPEVAAEELDDLDEDEYEPPEQTMQDYGPMVEVFPPTGVSERFATWPPPWSFTIKASSSTQDTVDPTPSQAHKETEMPMELNPDGSITATGGSTFSEEEQAGRKRPMVLDTLKDGHDRTWFHLPSGKWICEVEMRRSARSATGAWEYWRDSGFDSYVGHRKSDMIDRYGPMTNPSMDVVEPEGIDFGSTFDTTQNCRCSNRNTLTDEKEETKQLKVGSHTHCIDCGKLRP